MGGRIHPFDKEAKEYPVSCWKCGDSGLFWDEKDKINRPCPCCYQGKNSVQSSR